MNHTEQRLREGLGYLGAPVRSDVDLAAVIAKGTRLRRRRQAGWTALAALVVAAAVALPVSGLLRLGSTPVTVMGTPAPVPTASPATKASATIDLSEGFTMNGAASPYSSLAVTVTREGAGYAASFDVTTADDKTLSYEGSTTPNKALLHQFPRLAVSLIAALPSWRQSVYRPAIDGGVVSREVALPTLGVIVTVDLSEADDAKIAGLVWQDTSGVVRNDRGTELSSTKLGVSTGVDEVYYDQGLDAVFFRPAGADLISDALGAQAGIMRVSSVWKSSAGYKYAELGLLPEDAKNLLPTPVKNGTDYTIGKLDGSGRVVLILHGKASRADKGRLLIRLAYTDANGHRVVDTDPYR